MAQLTKYSVANDWDAVLDATINSAVTSLVLSANGATGAPSVPFKFNIDSEILICTAVTANTPSAGKDTLTVTRAADSSTAASHTVGATVEQQAYASQVTDLNRRAEFLAYCMAQLSGGGEGVIRTSSGTNLKVVAQGTPGMTVVYSAGAAFVTGEPVALLANENSGTFTAPVGNPRKDTIQISQLGVMSVVTGTPAASPSAPAVTANCYKLAEIYLRVAGTSIKNTDDATNNYITDFRTFV